MIIENELESSQPANEDKPQNKTIVKEIIYEIDGIKFIVKREFNSTGSSIIENLIVALLNKLEEECQTGS